MKVALLRESGGYGDIITMSAAGQSVKARMGADVHVEAFVPKDFEQAADHLVGIDSVVALNPPPIHSRRRRDTYLDVHQHPYLRTVFEAKPDKIVDLFCPGFLYEETTRDEILYSRAQLFAMAAGGLDVSKVAPIWQIEPWEADNAEYMMKTLKLEDGFIGVALRGTCSCRTFPADKCQELLMGIKKMGFQIGLLDCVHPKYSLPSGSVRIVGFDIPTVAAILTKARLLITVDTGMLHLSQAVGTKFITIFGPTTTAIVNTYDNCVGKVVNPGTKCSVPCNYRRMLGWNSEVCRKTGCDRMLSVEVQQVLSTFKEAL